MSEKISGYPLTAASIIAGSFLDISEEVASLVYVSKKLPAQLLLDLGDNIYNINGVLTGNRVVDGATNILKFQNMANLQIDVDAVIIGASAAGGNIALNTNTDGALIIPSSADPDNDVAAPINAMLKYDATDDDIRAYVGGSWVSILGGGNTLYSGDDNLAGNRTVGMLTNTLTFASNADANRMVLANGGVGIGKVPTAVFDVLGATKINAPTFNMDLTGASYAVINQGTAGGVQSILQLKGLGLIAMEFLSTAAATAIRLYKGNGGALETNLPAGLNGYINATAGDFALGHTSPAAGAILHTKRGDVILEGASDANSFKLTRATNQISIGSTAYANTKFSITNVGADTYSFLVLDQATTFEFSIREAGFVYTNGVFSAGNAAPTSASKIQATGDIELNLDTGWYYMGDPSTDGSWRMGFSGATDLVFERRIAGVWTNKGTFVG